jgi:hypothetical protein
MACADGVRTSGFSTPLAGQVVLTLVTVDKVDAAGTRHPWVMVIQQEVTEWH